MIRNGLNLKFMKKILLIIINFIYLFLYLLFLNTFLKYIKI